MTTQIKIGWVHINTGLYMTRTRPDQGKLRWGSLAPQSAGESEEPNRWEILPYAVGLLQTYVKKHSPTPERYEFLLPIYKRMTVREAVKYLSGANVVGFSTYVWNMQLSLAIAQRLKQQETDTLIVFGGPQVPDQAEFFLRRNPFVDLVCHGEGEQVFLDVLERSVRREWEGIHSISYLSPDGTFHSQPRLPRLRDLSKVVSPYLEGTFEPLMKANPQIQWMALWETNRGCPFSCSFCDWGAEVSGNIYKVDIDRLLKEIEWMAEHEIELVYCCDANFGIFPRDLDIVQYIRQSRLETGYPKSFVLENVRNKPERTYRIHKILRDAGIVGTVSFSLQSLNRQALNNIKRKNGTIKDFQSLHHHLTRENIETHTELILGLPGETYTSFIDGISRVIENGEQHRIFFYNCCILPNSEMNLPEYQLKFGIQTQSQRIVVLHGAIDEIDEEEVHEFLEIVIATDALPQEDWVKSKVYWWMTELLYFDRIMRIPFVLAHQIYSAKYRELIELFSASDMRRYPLLTEIRDRFIDKARRICEGEPEFEASTEWLGIWWPIDQAVLVELVMEGKLDTFYTEAEQLLADYLKARSNDLDLTLLHESIELNRQLLVVPFCLADATLHLSHNLWEFYQSVLIGATIGLEKKSSCYRIYRSHPILLSWEEWFERVILCHHQRSLHWYAIRSVQSEDTL